MTESEIRDAITAGEGQTIEFKQSLGLLKAVTKTLTAFADQPEGGTVLFGVTNTGSIQPVSVGVNTLENLAGDIKRATLSMTTAIPLLPDITWEAGIGVIAVTVPAGVTDGPFLARGRRYKRVGRSTHEVKMDYRQLALAYQRHLYDDAATETLGYRFCPQCGNELLTHARHDDPGHDRSYEIVSCTQCQWSDWTEPGFTVPPGRSME